MTIKVHAFDESADDYNLVATIHNDCTVSGSSDLASRFEAILSEIDNRGFNRADYYDEVEFMVLTRYNTGYHRATVS